MKSLIYAIALMLPPLAVAAPRESKKDIVIYEATLNGNKITVILTEAPFEPEKHKVTASGVAGVGDDARAIWPMVDGHEAAGFLNTDASIMKGIPRLTRLAVSFDRKIVEAPKELIAHVFMPHTDTSFDSGRRNGMISISSDAKAVVVDLAVGDAAWSGHQAFTSSAEGTCILGVPIPQEP